MKSDTKKHLCKLFFLILLKGLIIVFYYFYWCQTINRIQNKHFVYIMCVCTVYIYCVYINTHTCMYKFQNNFYFYILHIFFYNINYMNINTCKYFQYIYFMCVYLYIHNKYRQYTPIYANKTLFWMRLIATNHLTALIISYFELTGLNQFI